MKYIVPWKKLISLSHEKIKFIVPNNFFLQNLLQSIVNKFYFICTAKSWRCTIKVRQRQEKSKNKAWAPELTSAELSEESGLPPFSERTCCRSCGCKVKSKQKYVSSTEDIMQLSVWVALRAAHKNAGKRLHTKLTSLSKERASESTLQTHWGKVYIQ